MLDLEETDQLATYKCSHEVEPGAIWNKCGWLSERDWNSESADFTTRPRCLSNFFKTILLKNNVEKDRSNYSQMRSSVILADINECSNSFLCGQALCRNTLGGYYCTCHQGYVLKPDGRSCRGIRYTEVLFPD